MDINIILTTVATSATAIIVALISIVVNNRNQKKTAIELEKFKLSIEREKETKRQESENLKSTLKIIDSSLEYTQKIKDSIIKLVSYSSINRELERQELENIRTDVNYYFELFSKSFSQLEKEERELLHQVKSPLIAVNNIATHLLYKKVDNDNRKVYEELSSMRKIITDIQQIILIRKLNLMMNNDSN